MKTLYTLVILFLFSFNLIASDVVRNGTDQSEQTIWYTFNNLESFIDVCLKSSTCLKAPKHQEIITAILNSLPQERKNSEIITFKSEKAEPGFFIIEGREKLAFTGDNVGDSIFINTDLLDRYGPNRNKIFFTIQDSIQLLIHELGHHQGIRDHALLDLVGAKISHFYSKRIDSVYHNPFMFNLSALGLHHHSYKHAGALLIFTGLEYTDLSYIFNDRVSCGRNLMPELNPLVKTSNQFFNIAWNHSKGRTLHGKKELTGMLVKMCDYKHQGDKYIYYSFKLSIGVTPAQGRNFKITKLPKLIKLTREYVVDHRGMVKI